MYKALLVSSIKTVPLTQQAYYLVKDIGGQTHAVGCASVGRHIILRVLRIREAE